MPEQRIQNLETVVRALREDVRRLREEVERLRPTAGSRVESVPGPRASAAAVAEGGSVTAAGAESSALAGGPPPYSQSTPPPVNPRHPNLANRRRTPVRAAGTGLDLESWVGRYGTLAVAAVLVVMGVGAFVTWAATRFVIGPGVRVALGAAAAIALALLGRRLAAKGAVAFGSTLLALALAVAHVDAWAAGPVLGLVPNAVALGAAALASVALAALAIRERNETLFGVGVGGALLAPFVTGDRDSSVILLVSYGWVVVASALAAARPRDWRLTSWMLPVGALLYAWAATGESPDTTFERMTVAAFPLACAWAVHLWGSDRDRSTMSLALVGLGVLVLLALASQNEATVLTAVAVVGAASSYVFVETRTATREAEIAGGLVMPIGFLLAGMMAVGFERSDGAIVAGAWTAGAFLLARLSSGRQDLHLMTAGLSLLAAVLVVLFEDPVACVSALSASAVLIAYAARRFNLHRPLIPALLGLAVAVAWSQALLMDRGSAGAAFLTSESAAALAVVVAALTVRWNALPLVEMGRELLDLVAGLALFLWIRMELSQGFPSDTATFLLILYYAAFGLAAIAFGRARGPVALRVAGLALALYAAAKAVMQASSLTMIGMRVGSYLLVGGFLLAVAYWYRAAAPSRSETRAAG